MFGDNIANLDWEYWNGAAWAALTINNDNTANGGQPMSVAGVNSAHWKQPANWDTTAVGGVTGYWVRALMPMSAPRLWTRFLRQIFLKRRPNNPIIVKKKSGNE